jgi:hypothetical protein
VPVLLVFPAPEPPAPEPALLPVPVPAPPPAPLLVPLLSQPATAIASTATQTKKTRIVTSYQDTKFDD